MLLALAIGVAACTAATPTPAPLRRTGPPRDRRAEPRRRHRPRPRRPRPRRASRPATWAGRSRSASLDPAWTEPTLEFASDGDVDHLLVRRGGRAGRRVRAGPVALHARRRRARAAVAEPGARPLPREHRRRVRDLGLRRHAGERRDRPGTSGSSRVPVRSRSSSTATPAIPTCRTGAELQRPPGPGGVDIVRPRTGRRRSRSCCTRARRTGSRSSSPSATPPMAELWLPSLRDTQLAYCEVVYSAGSLDRSSATSTCIDARQTRRRAAAARHLRPRDDAAAAHQRRRRRGRRPTRASACSTGDACTATTRRRARSRRCRRARRST